MAQTSTMDPISRGNQSRLSSTSEPEIGKQMLEQTARIPFSAYLGLAIGSMVLSAALALFANRKEFANFVGLWAPSFLLMGIYNRIAKLENFDPSSSFKKTP